LRIGLSWSWGGGVGLTVAGGDGEFADAAGVGEKFRVGDGVGARGEDGRRCGKEFCSCAGEQG
jgi:hypothetical protein